VEKGFFIGQTGKNTKATGWMIKKMAKESFIFQMEENMMGIGRTIKEAARVFFIGQVDKNMMVNGLMIREMAKEFFIFQMEENMMAIGRMI